MSWPAGKPAHGNCDRERQAAGLGPALAGSCPSGCEIAETCRALFVITHIRKFVQRWAKMSDAAARADWRRVYALELTAADGWTGRNDPSLWVPREQQLPAQRLPGDEDKPIAVDWPRPK